MNYPQSAFNHSASVLESPAIEIIQGNLPSLTTP